VKKKNPVTVRRLPGGGYRVTDNGKVTAFNTTKKKAFAQADLLRGIQHGMKIRKNQKGHAKIYGKIFGKVKNPAWIIPGIRAARVASKPKRKNPVSVHSPSRPVEIYGRLLRIEAQKGPGHVCDAKCKAAGHRYYHDFSKHAHVYGMPDGSLKIVDRT